ncbi:MAG: pilus assembly protein PilP [Deltaproteobacteria bacterium]|nr:pilus assembly protein PilP [Deltaproteobacteria bacterium]
MIQLSKIVLIFCLMGALAGHTGCSKPEAPAAKPEIVRKKIYVNTGESIGTEPATAKASGSPGTPPLKPEIVHQKITDKPESVKAAPVPGAVTSSLPVSSPQQLHDRGDQTGSTQNKPSSESRNPLQVASASDVGRSYNPEGKIDPFVPLLKDEPLKGLPDVKTKTEKREPTTPLERIDLSQLKLTAIMRTQSGFKAMVEESTGKGYIVAVGTYVGIHSGKVTNILKDRIIVEEEIEDAMGNVTNRNSELKFQKPSGE